jgi:hypothetical protein
MILESSVSETRIWSITYGINYAPLVVSYAPYNFIILATVG